MDEKEIYLRHIDLFKSFKRLYELYGNNDYKKKAMSVLKSARSYRKIMRFTLFHVEHKGKD